ncbi:MAG: CHAT domain-containing protein [Deltaproteobacteria bacterium]|nr:CHAT domain-containing protein [Deltaproteobacteria bacterium]
MNDRKRGEENLKELLKERDKIDELMRDKFSKEMTIIFTDIEGSTTYFESRGDINGLSMVFKHNELLFPVIEHHQGTVIKTIGDSIMASFPDAAKGVRSAIEMQKALANYNTTHPKQDKIRIRIGLNAGRGIVEQQDVFGDLVNVAARIESLAEPGQILISQSVYEVVRQTDDIICRYFDCTKVKGKEEAVELYRVIWDEEEITLGPKRSATQSVEQRKRERKVFYLDISREENKLKYIAFEKMGAEERTIRPYEEKNVSLSAIEEGRKKIVSLLNESSKGGRVTKEILTSLRSAGRTLYDEMLTSSVKEELSQTKVRDLIINIDGGLVQIPWELLYDGREFFCQRFNMGRIVKTKQKIASLSERSLANPLKMLILCNPEGDLKDSYQEGIAIREEMDKHPGLISATLKSDKVKSVYLQERIRYFDILHYAGHADYDSSNPSRSGWPLKDGKFTSTDITRMMGENPLPALIFSNACHSGQTEEWSIVEGYGERIFSLANAFLLAGVQHYVGTFWEILGEPSSKFALSFYRFVVEGLPIGECVRRSRLELIKQYGEDTIVWASYMLYGDPSYRYFQPEEERVVDKDVKDTMRVSSFKEVAQESVTLKEETPRLKKMVSFGIGALLLIALTLGIIVGRDKIERRVVEDDPYQLAYQQLKEGRMEEARKSFSQMKSEDALHFEGLAAVYFKTGDYEQSLLMCERALETDQGNFYSYVIRGNIFLNQGKTDEAALEYEKATQLNKGADWI